MTTLDELVQRLRELAGRATPGPWEVDESGECFATVNGPDCTVAEALGGWKDGSENHQADADFIAACDPCTILRLLSELEAARKEKEALVEVVDQTSRAASAADRRAEAAAEAVASLERAVNGKPGMWHNAPLPGRTNIEFVRSDLVLDRKEVGPEKAFPAKEWRPAPARSARAERSTMPERVHILESDDEPLLAFPFDSVEASSGGASYTRDDLVLDRAGIKAAIEDLERELHPGRTHYHGCAGDGHDLCNVLYLLDGESNPPADEGLDNAST